MGFKIYLRDEDAWINDNDVVINKTLSLSPLYVHVFLCNSTLDIVPM